MVASANLDYYSYNKVLSYNGVYNFIVGARGLGKTYGAKRKVIRDFLKRKDEFIYLRRYKSEVSGKSTFFTDIAHEFPDVEFRINGNSAQVCHTPSIPDKEKRWETMGYFVVLANAQSKKGVSYHNVKTIIYDEFIIEKGHLQYLPNESRVFNDFYSTVDRWKDKTKVLFLANALTIMNPYFLEYRIEPKRGEQLIVTHNGFVVVHFPESRKFIDGVFATRFGQFIKGTDYAQYSVVSEFYDNNDLLLKRKGPDAVYSFSIDSEYGTYSVWKEAGDPTSWYLQEKRPKREILFTTVPENVGRGMVYLTTSSRLLSMLRSAYARGYVYFDSPTSRNAFQGVFVR